MKHCLLGFLIFIGNLGLSLQVQAQEIRYVSDVLHLPLRSGKGNEFRITHKGLPSSSKLVMVEDDPENGWMKVRTEDGKEGWVRSQYLIEEPTAAIKLAALEAKLANLNSGSKNLLAQISSAETNNKTLSAELLATQQTLETISTELSNLKKVSSGAIDLNKQHQMLLAKHQILQTESDTARAENQRLKNEKSHNEWLYGAFLLLCGIVTTLAIQAMSLRRKKSEWG